MPIIIDLKCPRCNGALEDSIDPWDGREIHCINCGYEQAMDDKGHMVLPMGLRDPQSDGPIREPKLIGSTPSSGRH